MKEQEVILAELEKKYSWKNIFEHTERLDVSLAETRKETKQTKELRRELAAFSRLTAAKKELEEIQNKIQDILILEKEEEFLELCQGEKKVLIEKEKECIVTIESLLYKEEKIQRNAVFIELRAGAGQPAGRRVPGAEVRAAVPGARRGRAG